MKSKIEVEKLTGIDLMQWACSMTIDAETHMTLDRIYRNEHSPMRTQLFKLSMYNIPTFVSTHFVRHNIGIIGHYCKTQRDDKVNINNPNRWTPTNHGILCNAQALINIARKRLCFKSHIETVKIMLEIKRKIGIVDPDLERLLVPECVYRSGVCYEDKMCGKQKLIKHWKEV